MPRNSVGKLQYRNTPGAWGSRRSQPKELKMSAVADKIIGYAGAVGVVFIAAEFVWRVIL